MKEKQHITIQIADVAPLDLQIVPEKEEQYRLTERRVNKVWSRWSKDFPNKSSKEILAMIAFEYGRKFDDLIAQVNSKEEALTKAEKALDEILQHMQDPTSLS